MKRLFVSFLSMLLISVCYSQTDSELLLDSMLTVLQGPNKPNISAETCNQKVNRIFRLGMPQDREKFETLINYSLHIADESGNTQAIADAHYNMARLQIAGSNGYSMATRSLLTGLDLYEKISDSVGVSKCYMQLGLIGYVTQYFEDGIKNFELSLSYFENTTSTYLMAITYSEMGNFEESKKHFRSAIKTYQESNDTLKINQCYMYMGKLYENEQLLDSAYYFLKLAIESQKVFNSIQALSRPYALISGYYLKANQLDSAKHYAQLSLKGCELGHDKISAMLACETLSQVYEYEKDFEKAHSYLKEHYKLKYESVQGTANQKIAEMRDMFDFKREMAEKQLKHQEEIRQKNRTKNGLLIAGGFILILAGGLYSRLQYVRKTKLALQNEKNISENLLLNILPHEIAQELKIKGKADARNFNQVSILFTDFKDFTEQSAKLSAADLVSEINHCFEAFDGIMETYGIEKIKTIGDAYMAAGGLPVPTDDSAKNTVLAAIEMQDFIIKRKAENESSGKAAFAMRVGIHTGPVVAGIVGVKKFQYDIWGDTVNTASRMESSSKVGRVNISQATYELLKDDSDFGFESRGKIDVKGKGEMEMYFVTKNESHDDHAKA